MTKLPGKLEDTVMEVEMPDGRLWVVPVLFIAQHRAKAYAEEFGSPEKSLAEDTGPLFEEDSYECADWAANNMNWSDVKHVAVEIETLRNEPDYEEGWCNGSKKFMVRSAT